MADDDELERLERFVGRKLTDRRDATRYRSRPRPRGRWTLRIADHILHQLGYPQPSVIAARLATLEGGEVLSDAH